MRLAVRLAFAVCLLNACIAIGLSPAMPAHGQGPTGPASGDLQVTPNSSLQAIGATDQTSGSSSGAPVIQAAGDAHEYTLIPTCGLGGQYVCYDPQPCFASVDGFLYDVLRDGESTGMQICVTEQQAVEQPQVTPDRVLRAFRRLAWPQSDLVVQPPGGQTLVNFATNFYTANTEPSSQSVTLLGQDVLIEATPTTYTWHFDDGTTESTSEAGAPYPALDVTHEYASLDTFAPRVDTTYTGRYRLNGGPWIAIPESLTVAGTPQGLETIEARPTLVDY